MPRSFFGSRSNGINSVHARYLALGGLGFVLGDSGLE
jgi:hypothetical protein